MANEEDQLIELYGDVCDVVERTRQGWPLEHDEDNNPYFHTSDPARAAARRIFEILGVEDQSCAADLVDQVFALQGVWSGINGRCNLPTQRSYHEYGARGIKLCEEWSGRAGQRRFVKWSLQNGYEPGLVVDRKNGKLGYCPANCRWTTQKQNCWNKSNNRLITLFGETKCVCEWGEDPRCLVHKMQFAQRITAGWEPLRALTTPLRIW